MFEAACKHLGIDKADVLMHRIDSEQIVIVVKQGHKHKLNIADLPAAKPKPAKPGRRK